VVKETRTSIREGVEAATRVTVQLLDSVVISSYRNPELGLTHEVLRDFLQSLGHVRSNDIRLFTSSNQLIYSSPPSTYKTSENPPRWFVKLVGPKQETVTRRIRFGTLVVISNPGGAIREAWEGVRYLLWLAGAFFLLVNGLIYWMLGRSLRPLDSIISAINRMQRGHLAARLPAFTLPVAVNRPWRWS
jgi:hypothetical protein